MKRFLTLFFVLIVCAAPAVQIETGDSGQKVSANNPLPVTVAGGMTVTIGSATFTFSPVFSDAGGSGTLALVDGSRRSIVNLGSDTIGLISALQAILAGVASTAVNTNVTVSTFSASVPAGSETIGLFWDAPLATPTITTVNAATTATVTNAAKRAYIIIQNQGATETVYVYPGATATPGESIAVYAGSSITRPWGSDVQVSYAASTTTQIVIDQEVRP